MGQVQLIVDEETVVSETGRDSKGRFVTGNKFNPLANQIRARYLKLRHGALKAVSEHDIEEIVEKLVSMAKSGDHGATRLLFQFVINNPNRDAENSREDQDGVEDVPPEYQQRLKTIHPALFRITNGSDHGDQAST